MNPLHAAFALSAISIRSCDLDRLFSLTDQIDPKDRDIVFTIAYLAFGMSFEEKGTTTSEVLTRRYENFKVIYRNALGHCDSEEFKVYALVCYCLNRSAHTSSGAHVARHIEMHRQMVDHVRSEMVKEEKSAAWAMDEMRQPLASIETLYREIEESRRAYDAFCRRVIQPLIESQLSV